MNKIPKIHIPKKSKLIVGEIWSFTETEKSFIQLAASLKGWDAIDICLEAGAEIVDIALPMFLK